MVKKISSVTNPTIVEFSKLSNPKIRFLTGLFAVEGEKALEDIINSQTRIKNIFVEEDYEKITDLPQNELVIVSKAVMKKLCSSDSPAKILTVAYQRKFETEEFQNFDRLLLLDGISDPGNLGTLIRTAVAFGFEGIMLIGNCVDSYNAKVIRSAAGNFFKVPILNINLQELNKFTDYQFVMTDLHGEKVFTPKEIKLQNKFILTLGSEANGISNDVLAILHDNIKIETRSVESLNVATAGAILMYEIFMKVQ